MLKVYNESYYISMDGGKWFSIGWSYRRMSDDINNEEIVLNNVSFEECFNYLEKRGLSYMKHDRTFFKKRPIICYFDGWDYKQINFNKISYKIVYKEDTHVSLNEIMKEFPAHDCMRYMKEHGLTVCPLG